MGLLRVLLALAVLMEHTGGLQGYWMIGGPLAVQAFFIISGFYMGLVLNERYDRPELNRAFYANRAIRIYSIYFLFLALYLLVFAWVHATTGSSPLDPYFSDRYSLPEKLGLGLLNITVVGQELPLWMATDQGHLAFTAEPFVAQPDSVFRMMLIPVAWSLSLELVFYALAPFIARRGWRQIAALLALSLLLRIVAAGQGLVADPFSYRFFPFELALFLAGVLAYKAWAARRTLWDQSWARGLALAVPLATLAYPFLRGDLPTDPFFVSTRIGYLLLIACALPAIHQWSKDSRLDRAVGELSYPLYLNHLLVLGMVAGMVEGTAARTVLVAAVSIALAWIVVRFIDEKIEAYRRRLAARAGAA